MQTPQSSIISWIINPSMILTLPSSPLTWILITGIWRNEGVWDDTAVWVD